MDKHEYLNLVNSRCEYNKYNHIYTTDIGPDFSVVEAELRPESLNPLGMAHGGFVYSLCDVAAGALLRSAAICISCALARAKDCAAREGS